MEKLYYYSFAFIEVRGDKEITSTCYIGFAKKQVTLSGIKQAKQASSASLDSAMLSCCYLGHMTKEEFNK